ncbi:MAG: GntR family transcriptional regulator [Firmicutes bacterium]|jgi:DNA-binding GntR family transcriptional regulator|nr:GntR family transcriptional regulator [Bacillota bacterium]
MLIGKNPMDDPKKIQRSVPLYQQVYVILQQKILRGEYRPGQVVAESLLAEDLGVSRTPIREALRQLEKDGLVQVGRYEVTISNPSREEFVELYLCRAALEQLVAERSALNRSSSDIDAMAQALEDAETAINEGNHAAVLQANTRFHDYMVDSTRMARLSRLMTSIRGPIILVRQLVLFCGEHFERDILREHHELLNSIRESNASQSKDNMARHMTNDIERGLARFDSC